MLNFLTGIKIKINIFHYFLRFYVMNFYDTQV